MYTEQVKEIIERKKLAQDCSEEESGYLKQWVKKTTIVVGSGDVQMLSAIQMLFPNEYGEALEEMEDDDQYRHCLFCSMPLNNHLINCPDNPSPFAQLIQNGYD